MKSKLFTSVAGSVGLAVVATIALGLTAATPAQAGVCPAITDVTGSGGSHVGVITPDCNVLLTINGNGTVTGSAPAGTANYDGSDDALIGILNNTASTLNHFFLTGPAVPLFGGIFGGMDGDGICEVARFSGAACASSTQTGNLNYAPDGVTFTPVTSNSGFVDIAGGLAPGAGFYFSLEEPATINDITLTVPEPATLAVLGFGLAALGASRRREAG